MLGSLLQPHIWTANLLFIGLVQGLIVSLIAMGIVLVYRSSRVINFAVGDLGVPAAAVLAVHGRQVALAVLARAARSRCSSARSSGTVVEIAIIRRLSKAPRVIVLVATIGIAELAQAVTHALPDYRTGELQIAYPSPMTSQWTISERRRRAVPRARHHDHRARSCSRSSSCRSSRSACGGCSATPRFGESVRATATNADLARLTGISPK